MSGKTEVVKGRLKEVAGILTGSEKLRAEGKTDQRAGEVKQVAKKTADKVKGVAKKTADKVEKAAKKTADNVEKAAKKVRK